MGGGRFGTGVIAGVLAGLLAGWSLGRLGQTSLRAPQPRSAESALRPDASALQAAPAERELIAAGAEASREEPAPRSETELDAPLITETLREYARSGIARGWSLERRNPLPEPQLAEGLERFESAVLELPEGIGRELGKLANQADGAIEDFLAHDPIALLDRLDGGGIGPLLEVVNDGPGFAALFTTMTGRAFDGPENRQHPDTVLEDGASLHFPAGVFRVRNLMEEKDPFPRDVTLRGAGMNATLLLLADLSTRGELHDFTLSDCTIFTENSPLFDLRRRPASVLFERVRVIGFDSGAGGSSLLDAPVMAVLARGCRFEGGYGNWPRGVLFDVRSDALLARFEACQIDQVELELRLIRPGASVAFVNCRLTNILDRRFVEGHEHPGVVFPGSSIEYFPEGQGEPPRKDLNELFPDWQKRIEE